MKAFLVTFLVVPLLLTFSTFSQADESCLRITTIPESITFLCGHDETSQLNLFALNEANLCFVGSAQMLTDKINAGLFNNSDDGLAEAEKLDGYHIRIAFWNMGGKVTKKTISQCE